MGSILYDFLAESFLFDEHLVAEEFRQIQESELRRELQRYREFCANTIDSIVAEVPVGDETNLFLGRVPSLDTLKKTLLYVPCHIVADPLLEFAPSERQQAARPFMELAGLREEAIDRDSLANAIRFMRAATPMVVENCLKFWPADLLDNPSPAIEVRYSDSLFRNELPENIRSMMHDKAIVRTVFTGDGVSYVKSTLEPSRMISVRFQDDPGNGYFYVLHQIAVQSIDDENRTADIAMTLPSTLPDTEQFNTWVEQSINQSAGGFFRHLLSEYRVASDCGASLNIDSSLAFQILQALALDGGGIHSATTSALIDLDLPFVGPMDLDTLVRIRVTEGESFAAFRRALEVGVRELRLESDPGRLELRKQNLVHELSEVQVAACADKVGSLRKQGMMEASVALLGLTGAVHTAGWSLLAALMAMMQGYRTYESYRTAAKTTPGYFLWRLQKETTEA